jgi:hypothetical protein
MINNQMCWLLYVWNTFILGGNSKHLRIIIRLIRTDIKHARVNVI